MKQTGDGMLATFDGPAHAVRCACAIREAVHPLGIDVRLESTGRSKSEGTTSAASPCTSERASPPSACADQVLVSRTVVDLVVGSGINFEPVGEHELKGVPGTWQLYQADPNDSPRNS